MGKDNEKRDRNRPDMPEWFTKSDAKFVRKLNQDDFAKFKAAQSHEALFTHCEEQGIETGDVRMYWHKTDKFSVMSVIDRPEFNLEEVFDNLISRYTDWTPPTFQYQPQENKENCAILNLYDAHLDKICLRSETGKDETLESNIASYVSSFDSLLSSILVHLPDTIIFPVGNDLFHANDFTGKTKRGTAIQYLESPEDAYERICDVVVQCIDKLAQTGAKIVIPFIKGNHDQDNITILGYWINKMYSNVEAIDINKDRRQRKYVDYGNNLFGFAHGDKEKSKINDLPLLMAEEQSALWAKCKYRQWYCGDLHHNFEFKFLSVKDRPGVSVEFLRSAGANDAWHIDHGWTGIPKSAEATIWKKEGGQVARYQVNVR